MKFFIHITILVISITSIVSCNRESVESVFQNMRKQACDSNYEGFFQYVDKQAVRDNFIADGLGNFTDSASEGKLSERSQGMPRNYEQEVVPEHMNALWTKYENWLRLGESGPLCSIKIAKINGNSITVNIPGHPDFVWNFKKIKGKWKLVSIL